MKLLIAVLLLLLITISTHSSVFEPLTPKLQSDIGLLSVNIPLGQLREKYWLHNLIVDLPCVDEVVTPNILVVTSEMNMSASAIMKPILAINLTITYKKTEFRLQGPLKALKVTHNVFKKHIIMVIRRYNQINSGPATLWGILSKTRCVKEKTNDVLEDTRETMSQEGNRHRKDTLKKPNTDRANILNIAGTGHTFNFHQARPDDVTPSLNLSNHFTSHVVPRLNALDKEVDITGIQLPEGRIFTENIVQDTMAYDQQCGITLAARLNYITCVLQQPEKETLC